MENDEKYKDIYEKYQNIYEKVVNHPKFKKRNHMPPTIYGDRVQTYFVDSNVVNEISNDLGINISDITSDKNKTNKYYK